MIRRFHRWQDKLSEPWRFIATITLVFVAVIAPMSFGGYWGVLFGLAAATLLIRSRRRYLAGGSHAK